MSSHIFFDSDDERDSFDIERREIDSFQRQFLSASFESSEDDEEGIIDGTKIPSSTKAKSRARHSYLDISTLSSPSLSEQEQENPFDIISKSIDIEKSKPIKKKKSLGLSKSKIQLDTNDIYDQDDSNHSRHSSTSKIDKNFPIEESSFRFSLDEIPSKEEKKTKVRKPTKADVLETERKMQQLSRSEQLVLPTFVPKPLESWHVLEKRSRQELMNEIRAQNPSFTPQDPELPELPVVNIESSVESTLADLTKLIQDKPSTSNDKLNKLSRFLNPDILKKKPVMKELNTMIDLSDTKKSTNPPTLKTNINISLDCIKSPSSSKKLFDMQKQLGIRMRAKRAAMLTENSTTKDDEDNDNDDIKEIEEDSSDSSDDNQESEIDKENEDLQVDDEETKQIISDEEEEEEEVIEEEEEEEKENATPSSDSNRPSLKTVLNRLESSSDSVQIQQKEQDGRTEWFNSARPAQFDSELEMLCSGAFDTDNIIPVSQNYKHPEPIAFSPLPTTQIDDEQEQPDIEIRRPKVRQLIDDDDDEDQSGSNEQSNSGSNNIEESEDEGVEEENEELIDYKKQLFEMEAEESGSEIDEKEKEKDDESDSDEEPDEELREFIDTAAVEVDDEEADSMAKVFLKIKAKEDEHQLKLLKEQYLDFEGDEDGRRIKLLQARNDDDDDDEDDPDYNSEIAEEDEDDDEDDEPIDLKDRMSELERQRSIQDNQAEELHLDEDLDNIGQHSSMFQKGLALKQKKLQSTITTTHIESTSETVNDNTTKKPNQTRSVTLSSVLLAKRFSSTLLAPFNRSNLTVATTNNTEETTITTKKQHNPRRHVFSTNLTTTNTNENQNPSSSGEKRSNSSDKSPKKSIKRFKQSTTTTSITTVPTKTNESSTSVFSALGFSNTHL